MRVDGRSRKKRGMLISHVHKFIYLKTRKTGGTSVEIYFEPYCVGPGKQAGDRHFREAESSKWGVIGSRDEKNHAIWYNHMPAYQIREHIGESLWHEYYKFCVVRNPFDKVVSSFWFNLPPPVRELLKNAEFSAVRKTFIEWIKLASLPIDRSIYTIGEEAALDYFVRFETLQADLEGVCRRLAIPWEPKRLGRYKSEYRTRNEHFSEYYSPDAAALVCKEFSWELEFLGYSGVFNSNAG
jgi:hypothetical protein